MFYCNGNIRTIDCYKTGIGILQRRPELKMKKTTPRITNHSNNHISNIENGHYIPSLEIFTKICKKLEVTSDHLLLGNMKLNDISKNITDNLLFCNEKSLSLISKTIEIILSE